MIDDEEKAKDESAHEASGESASLEEENYALRDRLALIHRSRRRWIDAATACLGPEWNGTPDDLRAALSSKSPFHVLITSKVEAFDRWCPFDGGPHQMVIVGGVSRCEKCTTCEVKT